MRRLRLTVPPPARQNRSQMNEPFRRAIVLPAAIAIVAAGAVLLLWQELRTDHEARIANVIEATSYATRSDLARRLIVQFQSLNALADFWISYADANERPVKSPLDVIRFEGIDAIAWSAEDGTRFLATSRNRAPDYTPSDEEWAPYRAWVADALVEPSAMLHGPVDRDGHAVFRYYLPIQRGSHRGALVAIIDAHDLLKAMLMDEAPGYAISVSCCAGTELYRRDVAAATIPNDWEHDGWIAPLPGLRWNVSHRPTRELAEALATSAVDSVLIVGLAMAALLGGLVFETRRANERANAANAAEQRVHKLHRELEERVVARTQRLHEVLRDLNTINLAVSHDLRSPLNAISLTIGQLQAGNRDEATGARLYKVATNVERMTAMLNRLLGYARTSAFESDLEDVDMHALAEQAAREQSLDERSVTIGPMPSVRADSVITHILLSNLIANAAKHGRSGRASKIEIGSRGGAPDGPVYFVRDNGPGLDPDLAARLFRPLADRSPASGDRGLGLGLAIAARAVERHGGRIWVESAPGQGATFLFTLRAAPRDDASPAEDVGND
jgi:signal transduction histidine kinase